MAWWTWRQVMWFTLTQDNTHKDSVSTLKTSGKPLSNTKKPVKLSVRWLWIQHLQERRQITQRNENVQLVVHQHSEIVHVPVTEMEAHIVNTIRSKHGWTCTHQQLISTLERQINNELHINVHTVYCSLQQTHTYSRFKTQQTQLNSLALKFKLCARNLSNSVTHQC